MPRPINGMALSTNNIFIIFAVGCSALILMNLSLGHFHHDVTNNRQRQHVVDSSFILQNSNSNNNEEQRMTIASQEQHNSNIKTENREENNFLPRVLAFVFPQFHRDSLNDRLWKVGFTDWDNLRKAPEKNRLGYKIPRPTELGYYNYTELEPRRKQGELAKQYGIDGLVYWFNDESHPGPNMHQPLMNMLKDGHPTVPFALHWCAIKWTVTWNADVAPDFKFPEPGVLQKQYFPDDDEKVKEHYNWLKQFFHHPNYIKVDGKPLFMLYQKKVGALKVLKKLQQLAKDDGFPGLYLTVGLNKPHEHLLDIEDEGVLKATKKEQRRVFSFKLYDKVVSYPNPSEWSQGRSLEVPSWCKANSAGGDKETIGRARDIAGIISSFDNTPRRNYEDANLFSTGEPDEVVERFRRSLDSALYYEACCFPDTNDRLSKNKKDDDRFILINAMNEWAEGMALEPSDAYGRKFLETVRDTKDSITSGGCSRG